MICLPAEEPADRGDRPHRVERDLVVPGAAARVEDRVREREEQLHGLVEIVLARSGSIAVGDLLREQVPVARRSSERGPSAQYSAITFCSSVSSALISMSSSACVDELGRAVPGGPLRRAELGRRRSPQTGGRAASGRRRTRA